jgi:hypothetical protein
MRFRTGASGIIARNGLPAGSRDEDLATDPHRDHNSTHLRAWAQRLRRHIAWVIAVKIALIALLFVLFFSADHRPRIDPSGVSDRLRLDR